MGDTRELSDRELMDAHARTILVQLARIRFMIALVILALFILTAAFIVHALIFAVR